MRVAKDTTVPWLYYADALEAYMVNEGLDENASKFPRKFPTQLKPFKDRGPIRSQVYDLFFFTPRRAQMEQAASRFQKS